MSSFFPSIALRGRSVSRRLPLLALPALVPALFVLSPLLAAQATSPGAAPAKAPSGPAVALSVDRLDFGKVKAGTTVHGEIKITNEGNAPLSVTRIGVTCDCARLQVSTPTRLNVPIDRGDEGKIVLALAPGEAATVKLSVDTEKLAAGTFEKRCLIVCSDRNRSPLAVPFGMTIERAPPPAPVATPSADGSHDGHEHAGEEGATGVEEGARPSPATVPLAGGGPPPQIESDAYKVAFGEVFRGEKLFHTFKLANHGAGDLEIMEIRSTCSCAIAKFSSGGKSFTEEELKERNEKKQVATLKPGEEAQLEVELKTAKSTVPGKDMVLTKQVRIVSNDPQRPSLALTLEANLISPFTIEPERLDFGHLKKGAGGKLSAVIRSDRLGPFEITASSTPGDEYLQVEVTRAPAAEGQPPAWRIDTTLSKNAPLGNYNSRVELAVNHERVKEIQLPVSFSIEPNVSFVGNRPDGSDFLDFDVMNGESDKTVELKIENGDPAVPYLPKSVTVEARPVSDAFKAELVEVEKGMKYVVKVTAPKALSKSRFFQGSVVITADHPDLAVKKVQFRGWFRPTTPPK